MSFPIKVLGSSLGLQNMQERVGFDRAQLRPIQGLVSGT